MELIKQIKAAEAEAKVIVEQAKMDAVSIGEDARKRQAEQMSIAQEERKQAIESAFSRAQDEGQGEVEELKSKAGEDRHALESSAGAKVDQCVGRVMDYLRQV
jgi:vacuolar-type H+-ATPase subunit H